MVMIVIKQCDCIQEMHTLIIKVANFVLGLLPQYLKVTF